MEDVNFALVVTEKKGENLALRYGKVREVVPDLVQLEGLLVT